MRLLAILHTTPERDVEQARARDSSSSCSRTHDDHATLLEQWVPALRPGGGARFLPRLDVLVIGLRHLADPASAVCEKPLVVDFAAELAAMVRALLAG